MWADDWEDGEEEKERVTESLDWGKHLDKTKTDVNENPSGAYNKLSEALRQSFPHEATCSMFCGGKKCKFCCPDSWKVEDQAVKGLFSHWVTDNILAMSRPITRFIQEFEILRQFKEKGISAIINVQLPGEHAACGDGVHNEEFSYRQQDFMDGGIFFYNFGWKDFGVAESMTHLLDMVKVMQFAIDEGKVAIHCHAGKGRTGVLIACYLVFHNRVTANEAVHYVRSRRPGSVQTGPQVKCVQDFEKFLKPYRVIFYQHIDIPSFNLTQFLMRQRGILHGYPARKLKFLPKIIYIICERLLKLAKKAELLHIPTDHSLAVEIETSPNALLSKPARGGQAISPNPAVEDSVLNLRLSNQHINHSHSHNGVHGIGDVEAEVSFVGKALIEVDLSDEAKAKVLSYEKRLNEDDLVWDELRQENDATVLATLMWHWLDQLKDPVVRSQDTELLFDHLEEPQKALDRLDKGAKTTIIYLMNFLVKLQPISEDLECDIIQRLISALTHKSLDVGQISSVSAEDLRASVNTLTEMNSAEKSGVFRFFYNLLEALESDLERRQLSGVTADSSKTASKSSKDSLPETKR